MLSEMLYEESMFIKACDWEFPANKSMVDKLCYREFKVKYIFDDLASERMGWALLSKKSIKP